MSVQIQRGVPFSATVSITDDTVSPPVAENLTGKTVFISVKDLSDVADNDNLAFISSKITSHSDPTNGETEWTLTSTLTTVPLGNYKADVRLWTSSATYINSGRFTVEVVDVVTKRKT